MEGVNITFFPDHIDCISSDTIQCDPAEFANWLCQLATAVNKNGAHLKALTDVYEDLLERMACLEDKITDLTQTVNNWETKMNSMQQQIDSIMNILNDGATSYGSVVARLNVIESLFPVWPPAMFNQYGDNIKIVLGNINVTSGGPTGNYGLWTRAKDQDNDLDFQ